MTDRTPKLLVDALGAIESAQEFVAGSSLVVRRIIHHSENGEIVSPMIKRTSPTLAALLLASVLAACATKQVPPDSKSEADDKNGVVVFSVSHDLAGGTRNTAIVYLNGGLLGGSNGTMFQSSEKIVLSIVKESDYADVHGHLYAISLPAGDHEFTGWQISNGSGLRIYPDKETPSQRFHVDAGQVKYLGSFHGNLVRGKNIFGITITGDGFLSVNDEHVRDTGLLIGRYPQYKGNVKINLLRVGPWIRATNTRSITDTPVQIRPAKAN